MDSDLVFEDDNSTITVTAGQLRFVGVNGSAGSLLSDVRVALYAQPAVPQGTSLGGLTPVAGAANMFGLRPNTAGLRVDPSSGRLLGGPKTRDVYDDLASSTSVVDLASELRLLHAAVLDLNARLKALGG